jgi:hypothetical protein
LTHLLRLPSKRDSNPCTRAGSSVPRRKRRRVCRRDGVATSDTDEKESVNMKVRIGVGLGLAVVGTWLLGAGTASATMAIQKQAKDAGIEVTNCTYCHNEKLPKKGETTHNDRGKFLVAEKTKRNAKDVDVSWLKDYKEPAK